MQFSIIRFARAMHIARSTIIIYSKRWETGLAFVVQRWPFVTEVRKNRTQQQ
jgi:hypothetical protein